MHSDKTQSVIIAGGGVGGLFAGALLAHNGLRVTVLEKNATAGGGLQCFTRNGHSYETGMHVMGGFEPGGNLDRICRYLGILDRLDIHHIDSRCMDEIRIGESGRTFRIPSGKENFIRALGDYFPEEREGIRGYVEEIYRITRELPHFYLEETSEGMGSFSDHFSCAADRLIADYVRNPELCSLLAYLNIFYGGMKGETPAYVHSLINVLYINGASRFVGGSQQLADALCDVIRENGGEVLTGREVTEVALTEEKTVDYMRTSDGATHHADHYIWAVHPFELMRMLPRYLFNNAMMRRVLAIPNTYSAFSVYIELKPDCFPYIPHTCHFHESAEGIWNLAEAHQSGFMYMTPPEPGQGMYAKRMLVHSAMSFDEVAKWKDTRCGHRGEDYAAWKSERTEYLLDRLERIYPGFRDMVARTYSSSPLTIRDYYHTPDGSIFGFAKSCESITYPNMSVRTKIPNLLLTGQNVFLHGMCGTPLTAIHTAEAILGRNFLIREIKTACPV